MSPALLTPRASGPRITLTRTRGLCRPGPSTCSRLGGDAFNTDVPDLGEQIGRFALDPDNLLGDRPLASLLFGANDIFFNGIPNRDPENVGIEASNAVADGALALSGLGFNDFLIFNLPDIGSTPAFSLLRPEEKPLATEATLAFNENLAKRVGGLRAGLQEGFHGHLRGSPRADQRARRVVRCHRQAEALRVPRICCAYKGRFVRVPVI